MDDYLVESITRPAADPNAGEVYYRYAWEFPDVFPAENHNIWFKLSRWMLNTCLDHASVSFALEPSCLFMLTTKILRSLTFFCICFSTILFLSSCVYLNRLMTQFMLNQSKYTLDSVLSELSCPLLLVWGDLDPWVGPAKANRIKEFYPKSSLVNLQAGHCPHDEVPELVNKALMDWLSTVIPEAPVRTL